MKEVIMGRVPFASLTSISLAAAAFTATSLVTAHAADLGPMVTKAPPPAPIYYNWTGFYLGANLGGSWGHQTATLFEDGIPADSFTDHPDGVIGGGQIGYNWAFYNGMGWGNAWVLGIEADIQGSSQRASNNFDFLDTVTGLPGDTASATDKLEWFGTVRGRIGIAFDRVLPYFTGGWAYGDRKFDGTLTTAAGTTSFSTSSNSTDGWTVGGGIEWAFWDHWTAKFEYLYVEFGNRNNNNTFDIDATPFSVSSGHFTDNIARAGVNYKF
jgi:outer membrane immunogenic protein